MCDIQMIHSITLPTFIINISPSSTCLWTENTNFADRIMIIEYQSNTAVQNIDTATNIKVFIIMKRSSQKFINCQWWRANELFERNKWLRIYNKIWYKFEIFDGNGKLSFVINSVEWNINYLYKIRIIWWSMGNIENMGLYYFLVNLIHSKVKRQHN